MGEVGTGGLGTEGVALAASTTEARVEAGTTAGAAVKSAEAALLSLSERVTSSFKMVALRGGSGSESESSLSSSSTPLLNKDGSETVQLHAKGASHNGPGWTFMQVTDTSTHT